MRKNNYPSVLLRADRTNEDNKYRTLLEKLIQLEVNEHLKKLHSAEFYHAPVQ